LVITFRIVANHFPGEGKSPDDPEIEGVEATSKFWPQLGWGREEKMLYLHYPP